MGNNHPASTVVKRAPSRRRNSLGAVDHHRHHHVHENGDSANNSLAPSSARGCDDQSATPHSTPKRTHSKKVYPLLAPRQRSIIQKSWQRTPKSGPRNVGSSIFMKILQNDATVAKMFGLHGISMENLPSNHKFIQHSATFVKTLNFIVSNLDDLDKISLFARDLGARHLRFEHLGFHPSFWDIFAQALTECAIDWEGGGIRSREALHVWRRVVAYVIDEMRAGFEKEKRKAAHAESTSQITGEEHINANAADDYSDDGNDVGERVIADQLTIPPGFSSTTPSTPVVEYVQRNFQRYESVFEG